MYITIYINKYWMEKLQIIMEKYNKYNFFINF